MRRKINWDIQNPWLWLSKWLRMWRSVQHPVNEHSRQANGRESVRLHTSQVGAAIYICLTHEHSLNEILGQTFRRFVEVLRIVLRCTLQAVIDLYFSMKLFRADPLLEILWVCGQQRISWFISTSMTVSSCSEACDYRRGCRVAQPPAWGQKGQPWQKEAVTWRHSKLRHALYLPAAVLHIPTLFDSHVFFLAQTSDLRVLQCFFSEWIQRYLWGALRFYPKSDYCD